MSYRNTFITDFIYQSTSVVGTGTITALMKVFEKFASHLETQIGANGLGYFAGMMKGLYSTEGLEEIPKIVSELEKVTKVPFRLTILFECGPAATYNIRPRE